MSNIVYRFFLDNDTEGKVQIDEPKGADELEIILTREDVGERGVSGFFGLNAVFSNQELSFYGEGRDYLLNIESTQGIDSEVRIDIDISSDGGASYQDFFDGIVNMESLSEDDDKDGNFVKTNIEQGGFYQRFLNRKSTHYNLNNTVDLNGATRETISAHTVRMFSQPIRKQFKGDAGITSDGITNLAVGPAVTVYGESSFEEVLIDELDKITQIKTDLISSAPTDTIYTIRDNTALQTHTFSVTGLAHFILTAGTGSTINQIDLQWFVQRNSDTPASIGSATTYNPAATSGTFTHNVTASRTVSSNSLNDEFRVYLKIDINAGAGTKNASVTFDHELTISVDTLDVDSNVQTFKIHEAFNKVLNGIMEQDGSLYSEVLGNTATAIQSYASNGCASFFAVTPGNQLRGKSLADYPFAPSFDELWDGINPIYNLGLEADFTNNRINIETKDKFFQTGSPVLQLPNINGMQRSIANEFYFKAANVGYQKWKSEEFNSDSDFNTRHSYSTRFETIGDKFEELSKFIAGGYAIENTRRLRESTKDWKLDDDNFIIALNRIDGGSPGSSMDEAEKDELFPDVSNIDFPTSTYNLRLSPARALLRWGNIANAGLNSYASSLYRFQNGEGNILLETRISGNCPGSFDNQILIENQDIQWDYAQSPAAIEQDPLFLPVWREFEYPLTLDQFLTLKDGSTSGVSNRRLTIEVSKTASNFIEVFVWNLSYNPLSGFGSFKTIDANS